MNPDGTVYGPLFQIEPDVFRGWTFVIHGRFPHPDSVINRRFK